MKNNDNAIPQKTAATKPAVIGIFDSGVGGLTVVREIRRIMPHQPIIYFGDTARTPYGTKGPETITRYAEEDSKFLLQHGANILVIACHSAASVATEHLKNTFDLPIFEVITPSIEQALAFTKNKKIGLIGTRATIGSRVYETKIGALSADTEIIGQACPLLVPLVEEGWLKCRETRMIVKKYLRPLKERHVNTLILGCTHYPLLKPIIQEKIGKHVKLIDPSHEVARSVHSYLAQTGGLARESTGVANLYFLSDLHQTNQRIVQAFLGERIQIERAGP
ncbi:MAG: glutamate racemase [Dissulfuribacterales bacterium]